MARRGAKRSDRQVPSESGAVNLGSVWRGWMWDAHWVVRKGWREAMVFEPFGKCSGESIKVQALGRKQVAVHVGIQEAL